MNNEMVATAGNGVEVARHALDLPKYSKISASRLEQ
jgi:hypothetical protein